MRHLMIAVAEIHGMDLPCTTDIYPSTLMNPEVSQPCSPKHSTEYHNEPVQSTTELLVPLNYDTF